MNVSFLFILLLNIKKSDIEGDIFITSESSLKILNNANEGLNNGE
jgi:hypothetical protein